METREEPPRPTWRIDLHCHSGFSRDALGTLDEIAGAARAKGLHGVCLTDHDSVGHHGPLRRWNDENPDGVRFFPGAEVSAHGGHVLAVGLQEAVPAGLPLAEAVTRIHDQGAVAVPAHPFRLGSGVGEPALDALVRELFAVEVWNAQEIRGGNRRAAAWAVAHGKGGTGGSDAHQVEDVGNGYTEFQAPVERLDQLLSALRAGNSWGVGRRTPLATIVRQGSRNLVKRVFGGRRAP